MPGRPFSSRLTAQFGIPSITCMRIYYVLNLDLVDIRKKENFMEVISSMKRLHNKENITVIKSFECIVNNDIVIKTGR